MSEPPDDDAEPWLDEAADSEFPDDDPLICVRCNGSGEGMYDGSTCSACGGSGVERKRNED